MSRSSVHIRSFTQQTIIHVHFVPGLLAGSGAQEYTDTATAMVGTYSLVGASDMNPKNSLKW